MVPRSFLGGGNVQGVLAKEPKKARKLRAVSRADKALLANQEETWRRGAWRERENVEGALLVIASEQPVLCSCFLCIFSHF